MGEEMILTKDLMSHVLRHKVEVISELKGSKLVGRIHPAIRRGNQRG